MSLLHNEDFTIWQLRTSYLSTIKDGIGDRLITINDSILNTPGFRGAGWSSAYVSAGSHIKRTYSPPIPTTTTVVSEYYRLSGVKFANGSTEDPQGLGLIDDGEDEDGGMVTGRGSSETIGPRNHARTMKRIRRKDRQHSEIAGQRDADEEDSSDLSDESDDEGDLPQRAAQQIKFSKMPIRTRAGSSPIRATDRSDKSEAMVALPSHLKSTYHYRTGSLGTAMGEKSRPRRDTTTSSDLSSDNELEQSDAKPRQIHFSSHDHIIEPNKKKRSRTGSRARISDVEAMAIGDVNEQADDSGAESVGSALSSEFGATAGSGSLLEDVGMTASLDSSSPITLMQKLQNTASSQNASPRKPKTPAPELHDLPPPRPISSIQNISLLSKALHAQKRGPTNPVEKFVVLSGRGLPDALNIKVYVPFSSEPDKAFDLPVARESRLGEQPAPTSVAETIGLALFRYGEEGREPPIERSKLTVNRWTLRMVEDGEIEYDFPALGRTLPIGDFTSNNNRAAASRGRARGKPYDEFALVEATQSEFEENERLYPKYSQGSAVEGSGGNLAAPTVSANQPAQNKTPTSRTNPILGQPFSSALNDSTLTPADRPAVPTSHATPRMGVLKTLKIRFVNLEGSAHVMTINTSTDSYIAEILDTVCKRWGLDKGNYLLKVMGSSTIAPLDRTVEALGSITDLDLVRRRFGAGPLSLTGSPGSSSPNAPLVVDNASTGAVKKGKKGGQRMLHPLSQTQDLIGGYHRRYHVYRKQPMMSLTASNYRILAFDNDYMHIMPADTGKTGSEAKTRSINFNDVVGCKVSRRHPKSFRVVVLRGNEANEQKRYEFEARNPLEAIEIVDEIKKNMAHYRI